LTSDVGDVRIRLFRSSELLESGEIESALFRPNLADVRGLSWPDPRGEGNSNPSNGNAELGRLNSCETELGVPDRLGKSGEMSPYPWGEGPKLLTLPLLLR